MHYHGVSFHFRLLQGFLTFMPLHILFSPSLSSAQLSEVCPSSIPAGTVFSNACLQSTLFSTPNGIEPRVYSLCTMGTTLPLHTHCVNDNSLHTSLHLYLPALHGNRCATSSACECGDICVSHGNGRSVYVLNLRASTQQHFVAYLAHPRSICPFTIDY